eukprot:10420595-Alexandrium_andersonii.AAC.1
MGGAAAGVLEHVREKLKRVDELATRWFGSASVRMGLMVLTDADLRATRVEADLAKELRSRKGVVLGIADMRTLRAFSG